VSGVGVTHNTPLIRANAGTQIVNRRPLEIGARCPERGNLNLGPGIRRDERRLGGVAALTLTAALALAAPAFADPLNDGLNAANRGDYAAAQRLLKPLAERGNVRAQFNYGIMFERGTGMARNPAEAVRWYRLSAGQGYVPAMTNLGEMYLRGGAGVPQNYPQALVWLHKAAPTDTLAQFDIGYMYAQGLGVPKSFAEADKWWAAAAVRGQPRAMLNYGIACARGDGRAVDMSEAYMWLALAAARIPRDDADRLDTAVQGRDQIAGKLTRAQLAAAQQRVRAWKPLGK
jgi:TPR repeat protein